MLLQTDKHSAQMKMSSLAGEAIISPVEASHFWQKEQRGVLSGPDRFQNIRVPRTPRL
jgi:hypothetical protein